MVLKKEYLTWLSKQVLPFSLSQMYTLVWYLWVINVFLTFFPTKPAMEEKSYCCQEKKFSAIFKKGQKYIKHILKAPFGK